MSESKHDHATHGGQRHHVRWSLTSKALNAYSHTEGREIFAVHGIEELGRPYQFDVGIAIPERTIRGLVLLQGATLKIDDGGDWDAEKGHRQDRYVSGLIGAVQSIGSTDDRAFFRVALVPRLWKLTLTRHSRVWKRTRVRSVLEEIFDGYGLKYRFEVGGAKNDALPPRDVLCQFDETDFDFVSRWLEREGWYYWFEQPHDAHHAETLVITDRVSRLRTLFSRGERGHYVVPREHVDTKDADRVPHARDLAFLHGKLSALPHDVSVRNPKVGHGNAPPEDEHPVVEAEDFHRSPVNQIRFYGEHILDEEERQRLTRVRAEEFACRRHVYEGAGTIEGLSAGHRVHIGSSTNGSREYLVTRVEHWYQSADSVGDKGLRRAVGRLQRIEANTRMELSAWIEPHGDDTYQVAFECVPTHDPKGAHREFRPARTTPVPRVHSMVRATHAGEGRIKLDFDERGVAIRARRELPPGMRFPLEKGSVVLVKFANGCVDMPYVCGVVRGDASDDDASAPDDEKGVIASRLNEKTHRSNSITMDDDAGSISIEASDPKDSYLKLGEVADGGDWHAQLFTKGRSRFTFGDAWHVTTGGDAVHRFDVSHHVSVGGGDPDFDTPNLHRYQRRIDEGRVQETVGEARFTADRHWVRVDGARLTNVTRTETVVGPARNPIDLPPAGSQSWQSRTVVGESGTDDAFHEITVHGDHASYALRHVTSVGPTPAFGAPDPKYTWYQRTAVGMTTDLDFTQPRALHETTVHGDHVTFALNQRSKVVGDNELVVVHGGNDVRVGGPQTWDIAGTHHARIANAPALATVAAYTVDVGGSVQFRPTEEFNVSAPAGLNLMGNAAIHLVTNGQFDVTADTRVDFNTPSFFVNSKLIVFS